MSIGNLVLGVNSVTVSYLIHYDSLSQNATDFFTKCDSYFIKKCDRSLLQNASVFYYKMRQFYYKMRQLLQNATFITNCNSTSSFAAFMDLFLQPCYTFLGLEVNKDINHGYSFMALLRIVRVKKQYPHLHLVFFTYKYLLGLTLIGNKF